MIIPLAIPTHRQVALSVVGGARLCFLFLGVIHHHCAVRPEDTVLPRLRISISVYIKADLH